VCNASARDGGLSAARMWVTFNMIN
jgi:hypothetical protein